MLTKAQLAVDLWAMLVVSSSYRGPWCGVPGYLVGGTAGRHGGEREVSVCADRWWLLLALLLEGMGSSSIHIPAMKVIRL